MSDNPEKCANYLRIVRFTIDAGTEAVRDLLYYYKAKHNLAAFFAGQTISDELRQLKKKHILSNDQYQKVITSADADEFDLSLLLTLLTNIFACMIDKPVNGWSKSVDKYDQTIGADLLRLKELRNIIIGHKVNTFLSIEKFEDLWGQLEDIITRILKFVSGGTAKDIKDRIEEYKTKALEPANEREQKYIDLIQQWYDEFTTQQNEVEKYCERLEEFSVLFNKKIPERYSRYVLLLYEGGMLVLTSTLQKELRKQKTDLKSLLRTKSLALTVSLKQKPKLIYGDFGEINTDVSTWGLGLFADVMLSFFRSELTYLQRTAINDIKEASANYARSALASIDSDKFRTYWTDIVSNLNILSAQLDERTQMECQRLIKKHDREEIDEDAVKLYLSQLLQDCRPLNSLIALYKDTRKKLKESLETMRQESIQFGKEQTLELKMMTIGKTEEKRELAEDVLCTVWQQAVSMTSGTDDFQKVKEAVHKILERIHEIDGVKVVKVEKHCISVTLHCASSAGCLDLLNYMNSEAFFDQFECLSGFFGQLCGENITVTAFITLESMKTTLDSLYLEEADDEELCTILKLRCTTVHAIDKVREQQEDDEAANAVNELAQALSEHVDESVSIKSSLELGGLGEVLANPLQSLLRSPWQPFLHPPVGYFHRKLSASTHLTYLQELVDDIQSPFKSRDCFVPESISYTEGFPWEDEVEEDFQHKAPVHRASTPAAFGSFEGIDDFYNVIGNLPITNENRYSLSRYEDSPVSSGLDSPNAGAIDSDSNINWDELNISKKSHKRDSSCSSSVCSLTSKA